ncbi:unnamed protein product [Lactuca virosa]|uniref:Uncharacterized protein n=1 Tax=Lactuca virosa TaxID=75947 RepID=A0AAU9P1F6_9ASTR|nr:unnamed protein product [Lactuca virosa]
MASSLNANNSSHILYEVKKPALTKSINDTYSFSHMNAIRPRLETSNQNHEEKQREIESTNLIHKDVVSKYLYDEIRAENKKLNILKTFVT